MSHYRRHPGQTAFMAVGLLTGVALWLSVQLINDHAEASYGEADQLLGAESAFWIRSKQGKGIALEDYINLRLHGFTEVYPVIETRVITTDGKVIPIIATDLLALPLDAYGGNGTANSPLAGNTWLQFIQPGYQSWYSIDLAKRLGLAEGDEVALANGRKMPPALIQSRQQQGLRAFLDIGAAFSVLSEERFSYLAVTSMDPAKQKILESLLPAELMLVKNQQVLDLTQLTESLHTHLTAMGLLSFAVGLFIVFNAVRFSLLTRQGTFNTLRELGVSVQMISAAVILETLAWSLLGTISGVLVGYLLSGILLPTVAGSLQSLYGAIVETDIQLSLRQLLLAWLMTLFGLVFALAGPLWSRLRMNVIDGRSNSVLWSQDERARTQMMWASWVMGLLAVGAFFRIETVVHGFVTLALILFSVAFLLPAIIQHVIRGAQGILPESSWKWRWATSDAFAQLPQLRIALMALLLTLTANIGVTMLVGSFRDALSNWLELRLSADIYLQNDAVTETSITALNVMGWHVASHQRIGVSTRWLDRPARVQGVDVDAPDITGIELVEQTSSGFVSWNSNAKSPIDPQPILANEQVKHLGHVNLGDVINLAVSGKDYHYEIVGFFHDYGTPYYRFYLPYQIVKDRWLNVRSEGLALWVTSEGIEDAEKSLLEVGAEPGEWIRQSDIKRVSLEIFDRTFQITAALNSLTLIVAGVALLAALLAIHQQRLPEYAHWHSLGVTFREWLTLVAIPLTLMVLVTGMLAIPLGWVLSWMLVYKLNVVAFGWTMPLVWSWPPVVQLFFVTACVVAAAMAVVALQVRKRLPNAIKQLGGVGL
jgi:putative ABC transport system permease protein